MLNVFAVYLAAHFLAYVVVLRRSARLRAERGIFLYHLLPATVTGLAGLAFALAEPAQPRLAELVLLLSVHGIYSMSFLELWSLAQGGYSLSILRNVASAEANRVALDFSHLERIGATKQRERIAGLEALGLITAKDGTIALTRRGTRAAFLLSCLRSWIDPGHDPSQAA